MKATRPALKGLWHGRLGILGLPARDGGPLRPLSPEGGSEAGSRSLVLPPGGDDWDGRRQRARRIFTSLSRVSELRHSSRCPNPALWGSSSPKSPEEEAIPNSIPRYITSSLCKAPCALGRKIGRILSQMWWAAHSLIHSFTQSICICAASPLFASCGMQSAESRHQAADHNAHRDITRSEGDRASGAGAGVGGLGPGSGQRITTRRQKGLSRHASLAVSRLSGVKPMESQKSSRKRGRAGRGAPDHRGDTFFPGRQNLCGNQERASLRRFFSTS